MNQSSETANNVGQLVDASNQFALDLYSKMATQSGNLLFSPSSISFALAMAFAGANRSGRSHCNHDAWWRHVQSRAAQGVCCRPSIYFSDTRPKNKANSFYGPM
jgi:hypothetical protein